MKIFRFLFLAYMAITGITPLYAQSAKPVVEGDWKIKLLKDSGKMMDLGTKHSHVSISTKGKSITLHVGCNHLSSKFEFITADQIKPFELTATRKSCSPHLEELESSLRYALEQTNSVRKNGTKIEFYKDIELLIVMERHEDHGKKKGK